MTKFDVTLYIKFSDFFESLDASAKDAARHAAIKMLFSAEFKEKLKKRIQTLIDADDFDFLLTLKHR